MTMRKHSLLSKVVSVAVCFGVLFSGPGSVFAGNKSVIKDIELNENNTVHGQVLNTHGNAVDGAVITLNYQGVAIAAAKSDAKGRFAINGIRPGAHEVAVGAMTRPVRIWKQGSAPQGAMKGIVMAGDETIIRGQDVYGDEYCETCPPGVGSSGFGMLDVITLATVGAAVTAAVVSFDNRSKLDDLENAINAGFNQANNPGSP